MTKPTNADDKKPLTLDEDDVTEVENTSRRSAIARVGAIVASAIFGAAVLTPSEAEACNRVTGRTNSDPSDGVNRGRNGITDADPGDGAQCGRGRARRGRRSCTDSDSGAGGDRPGRGRNC
jgi:hypothetical protein